MIKVKFGDKVDIRLEKRYERDKKSSYTDIVVKMSEKTYPIKYFNDTKRESICDDFKIYQGNTLHGSLDWKRENYGDRQLPAWIDAHPPILLNGTYAMNWLSYSNIGFKYQVAEINKAQSQSKSAAH